MDRIQHVMAALLLLVTGVGSVQAQELQISMSVVSAGGSESGTVGVRLQSTLGQVAVGSAGAPAHGLGSGFWHQVRGEAGVVHTSAVDEGLTDLPTSFALDQNYPNPFNPATTIAYDLPSETYVRVAVYDVFGREISILVDDTQRPGRHEISFAARGLASGLYLYRIEAGDFREIRSMILAK